ncbi:hypothetical protein NQ317_016592 [Molorchus minor]|uniref:Uncharacterized protein n=1 Tax=Molorchus minor TaxID=1323400 RepID=A0ABQ9IQZ8_9CUCU|nr:hypothetical protein NQ317_016592 [Molorchus minor]
MNFRIPKLYRPVEPKLSAAYLSSRCTACICVFQKKDASPLQRAPQVQNGRRYGQRKTPIYFTEFPTQQTLTR